MRVCNLAKIKFIPGFAQHFEPEGVEYWKEQQATMWAEIGTDEYVVTNHYLHELGVSAAVERLVNQTGLEKLAEVAGDNQLEDKLLMYADLRVGPEGVISVTERLTDITERYVPEKHSHEEMIVSAELLGSIEKELFSGAVITPADINDASTAALQIELLDWEIETA